MSCVVICIALGVDVFRGGLHPPLYIRGDRATWKVLAEYSRNPTTTQSGNFLCTAASPTPIWVVTREVRYIHELSLTLEYSMPINSPAALGLTVGHGPSSEVGSICDGLSKNLASLVMAFVGNWLH